jgi:tetratricopeptide (TPR) repeat protein
MKSKKKNQKETRKPGNKLNKNLTNTKLVKDFNKFSWFYEKEILIVCSIFLISLLVRIIYLISISNEPLFNFPSLDDHTHIQWAEKNIQNNFNDEFEYFRAPIYPLFLSVLLIILGKNLFFIRLVQMVIGSISAVLIYKIGKNIFNKKVGFFSGLFSSFYWLFIFFEAELLIPVLLINLILLFFLFATNKNAYKISNTVIISIIFVFILYTRPNIILLLPVIPVWYFIFFKYIRKRKDFIAQTIKRSIIFVTIIFALMCVYGWRNYKAAGYFSLLPAQGGINFYIGNGFKATGNSAYSFYNPSNVDNKFYQKYKDFVFYKDNVWRDYSYITYKNTGKFLSQKQVSDYWYRITFNEIFQDPGRWIRLMLKKAYFFVNSNIIPSNKNINEYWQNNSGILGFLRIPLFGILLLLFCYSIIINRHNILKYSLIYLFIFIYCASIILFFVNTRYKVVIIPFLIIFSMQSLYYLINYQKLLSKNEIIAFLLLAIIILPVSYSFSIDLDLQIKRLNLNNAVLYRENKMYDKSIEEYEKVIKLQPENHTRYYNDLGLLYYKKGSVDKAITYYKVALAYNPDFIDANYNLGILYKNNQLPDKAIDHFKKVVAIDSQDYAAFVNLAELFKQKKLYEQALDYYKNALAIKPNSKQIQTVIVELSNKVIDSN